MGHRLLELRKATVVHVGGRDCDVSQTRGREEEFVFRISGEFKAPGIAKVVVGGKSVVAELVIGEVRAAVALKATGTPVLMAGEKEIAAAFFGRCEGGFAGPEAIIFRIVADDGEEVVFEGEGELFGGDGPGPVGFLKIAAVALGAIEVIENPAKAGCHFEVTLDWLKDLIADGGRASIPEEVRLPGEVKEGRGVSEAEASLESAGAIDIVAKGKLGDVTGGAGDGAIDGENGVVEEAFAEIGSGFCESIVGGKLGGSEIFRVFESDGLLSLVLIFGGQSKRQATERDGDGEDETTFRHGSEVAHSPLMT